MFISTGMLIMIVAVAYGLGVLTPLVIILRILSKRGNVYHLKDEEQS